MKYKLKIEFDYNGLEKDEIRDYKLDLVGQTSGLYFMKIITDKGTFVQKLIKE